LRDSEEVRQAPLSRRREKPNKGWGRGLRAKRGPEARPTKPLASSSTNCSYPRIAFRSASGVLMGLISKFFTNTSRTLGVMKAGRLGPRRMFLIPR